MFGRFRVLGVPSFRQAVDPASGRSFTVYQVQIVYNGNITTTERRYSEFSDLNKKLQKILDVRVYFPPKRVLNRDQKFLEDRRQGLESYLQAVVHETSDDLPKEVYDFFGIVPSQGGNSDDNLSQGDELDAMRTLGNHQPVITFDKSVFLLKSPKDTAEEEMLPNIVLQGCLLSLYDEA